tara:strand:- start:200 stop:508 length:309 start_codon:yes stop_codon:yes gene_type:complete
MTNYQQTANPNATNSELDAKVIIHKPLPDCKLDVLLTEEQISTILYVLEGYVQGNDDEQLCKEVDNIFKELESAVDKHHDILDSLCDNVEINTVDTNKRVIL